MFRTFPMLVGLSLLLGCRGGTPTSDPEHLPGDPDQVVLYSIDGPGHLNRSGKGTPVPPDAELLHQWPVLGKVEVADPLERRKVVAALNKAIRDRPEAAMKCFVPRHAIRVVKGGEAVEMVICFECLNYQEYRGSEEHTYAYIARSAQEQFDAVLRKAGVPLAPK